MAVGGVVFASSSNTFSAQFQILQPFAQTHYTRTQTHDKSYFALNFIPLLYSIESPSVERPALKPDTDNV